MSVSAAPCRMARGGVPWTFWPGGPTWGPYRPALAVPGRVRMPCPWARTVHAAVLLWAVPCPSMRVSTGARCGAPLPARAPLPLRRARAPLPSLGVPASRGVTPPVNGDALIWAQKNRPPYWRSLPVWGFWFATGARPCVPVRVAVRVAGALCSSAYPVPVEGSDFGGMGVDVIVPVGVTDAPMVGLIVGVTPVSTAVSNNRSARLTMPSDASLTTVPQCDP